MAIELMNKESEGKLVDSIMEAIKLSNAGSHPNDAIAKVASDKGYNQNYIRRMAEAYNVSKTLKHQKEASGEAKAGEFTIADADAIIGKLYPDKVSAPATEKDAAWEPTGADMCETRIFDLSKAPTLDKHAEVSTYDAQSLDILMNRAIGELEKKARTADDSHTEMAAARMQLFGNIDKLASYFRTTPHEPFAKVEAAALQFWGDEIKPLMNTLWDVSKRAQFNEKRASGPEKVQYKDVTPYKLLNAIVDNRRQYVKAATVYAAASKSATDYKDEVNLRIRMFSKVAGILAPAMLGSMLGKGLPASGGGKLPSELEVIPLDYENERRGIQSKLMLHDFMRHDPVISKAAPERVIKSFNDISAMAPRAVESPMIMRGLLRKSVEAESFDPYELANILEMESKINKLNKGDSNRETEEAVGA